MALDQKDYEDLKYAKSLLENPSVAAKLVNVLGKPIERGLEFLPENWSLMVQDAARKALRKAFDFAIMTMDNKAAIPASNQFHKISVAALGALGGAFGLATLPIELPVSKIIMLRSIADVARSEGEDIKRIETKLACMEVFALGGGSKATESAETGYYAVRASLATLVSEATKYIGTRRVAEEGAPALIRLIDSIATRFGVVVSEEAMATAIPALGAIGGALVNAIFIDHFQDIARGHFIVRRLERIYGEEEVKREYEKAV